MLNLLIEWSRMMRSRYYIVHPFLVVCFLSSYNLFLFGDSGYHLVFLDYVLCLNINCFNPTYLIVLAISLQLPQGGCQRTLQVINLLTTKNFWIMKTLNPSTNFPRVPLSSEEWQSFLQNNLFILEVYFLLLYLLNLWFVHLSQITIYSVSGFEKERKPCSVSSNPSCPVIRPGQAALSGARPHH